MNTPTHLKDEESLVLSGNEKELKDTTSRIAAHYGDVLEALGEDPSRAGLLKTSYKV